MPTTDVAIGFQNKWYPMDFKNAIEYSIGEDKSIQILAPECFLATKLEAYESQPGKVVNAVPEIQKSISLASLLDSHNRGRDLSPANQSCGGDGTMKKETEEEKRRGFQDVYVNRKFTLTTVFNRKNYP